MQQISHLLYLWSQLPPFPNLPQVNVAAVPYIPNPLDLSSTMAFISGGEAVPVTSAREEDKLGIKARTVLRRFVAEVIGGVCFNRELLPFFMSLKYLVGGSTC